MTVKYGIDLDAPMDGLLYEKAGGVARLTINRPERGNSLTPAMQRMFRAAWEDLRDDDSVRVAIVSAAGDRHFCTGFDVGEAEGDQSDDVFRDAPLAESVFWSPRQNDVWKPVICVVNGLCVGGGLHFVVDADITVATRDAAFLDAHVNVGMVGALENIGLARRLPLGTALRMTLVGRDYRLSADRAWQLGLVDELADDSDAANTIANTMATSMLANSPAAMYASKRALWQSMEMGYTEALESGWDLLRAHWKHPDFKEGPRAFADKRPPRWNPDPSASSDDDGKTGGNED